MKDTDLLKLDFNAIKLLKVLGEETNTKRAGERLFVSQPAISKSLKKLREQFNDPLFIRKRHGLEPTPKCEELLEQLPKVFSGLEALFEQGQTFLPEEYDGEISIHINTVLYEPLMTLLFDTLSSLAPLATLNIQNWSHDTEQQIKTRQVDLGINFMPLAISKEILQHHTVSTQFMICCRQDHPLSMNPKFTPDELGQWPFAIMLMPDYHRGEAYAETYLKARDILPKVRLRTDKMALCFDAVRKRNCVFPVSHIVQGVLPDDMTLLTIDHFEATPDYSIGCFYSHRSRRSPYVVWLHEVISNVLAEMSAPLPKGMGIN